MLLMVLLKILKLMLGTLLTEYCNKKPFLQFPERCLFSKLLREAIIFELLHQIITTHFSTILQIIETCHLIWVISKHLF